MSQAGLSEQVRKLETLLGCPLFERTTRRIVLTPKGEALIVQARTVLGAARVLLEMARESADPLAGPLRLGVIATLGPYYLPGLLWEVRTRFPALRLRLQEGLTVPLVQDLQTGILDMLLAALPLQADGLVCEPLFFEPFLAVLPAPHPLAGCYCWKKVTACATRHCRYASRRISIRTFGSPAAWKCCGT